jgi:hypothetical protein
MRGIVHAKEMFLERKGVMSRLWARPEKQEQTDSRAGAVEQVWCKHGGGNRFMANDRAGERGNAGRAWAGHNADIGLDGTGEGPNQWK